MYMCMYVRNPFLSIHNIYSTHVNTILATPYTYTDICTCVRSTGYVCCRIYMYAQKMELTHIRTCKTIIPTPHTCTHVGVCACVQSNYSSTYMYIRQSRHTCTYYIGVCTCTNACTCEPSRYSAHMYTHPCMYMCAEWLFHTHVHA